MKRRRDKSKFSSLYPTATAGQPRQPRVVGDPAQKTATPSKFASPSVPRNPESEKTRADFQKTDGIAYYKQVCFFVLLEGHVNQGVPHQAIFDTEKQDL